MTFDKKNDKAFTITPRELTVTPVLKDEIKAGIKLFSVTNGDWRDKDNNAENVKNLIESINVSSEEFVGEDKTCFFDKERYYKILRSLIRGACMTIQIG